MLGTFLLLSTLCWETGSLTDLARLSGQQSPKMLSLSTALGLQVGARLFFFFSCYRTPLKTQIINSHEKNHSKRH